MYDQFPADPTRVASLLLLSHARDLTPGEQSEYEAGFQSAPLDEMLNGMFDALGEVSGALTGMLLATEGVDVPSLTFDEKGEAFEAKLNLAWGLVELAELNRGAG